MDPASMLTVDALLSQIDVVTSRPTSSMVIDIILIVVFYGGALFAICRSSMRR